jgi:hypothetical protein
MYVLLILSVLNTGFTPKTLGVNDLAFETMEACIAASNEVKFFSDVNRVKIATFCLKKS